VWFHLVQRELVYSTHKSLQGEGLTGGKLEVEKVGKCQSEKPKC